MRDTNLFYEYIFTIVERVPTRDVGAVSMQLRYIYTTSVRDARRVYRTHEYGLLNSTRKPAARGRAHCYEREGMP